MAYKDIRDRLKTASEKILVPIIALLNSLGLSPNIVTLIGLAVNIIAAFLISRGMFISAGLVILFAGVFDMLDGALARKMGKKTKFGGFLDSTTDRVSEGAFYLALIYYYLKAGSGNMVMLSYAVMFLSFLISYIRARAGGLQIDCEEGLYTRTERIITLVLGLLLYRFFDSVFYALAVIAVLSAVTVVQRIYFVYTRASKPAKIRKK
jgi:CDP-diacylglycerol---glycerol-3-phosphate 3-phosphatidyltransferase